MNGVLGVMCFHPVLHHSIGDKKALFINWLISPVRPHCIYAVFLRKAETQNTKSAVSLLNRSSSWRGLEGEAVERKIQSTTALLLLRPRPALWMAHGRCSRLSWAGLGPHPRWADSGGGRRKEAPPWESTTRSVSVPWRLAFARDVLRPSWPHPLSSTTDTVSSSACS